MRDAYWCLIQTVRKRLRDEVAPKDITSFLQSIAQDACAEVAMLNTENGTGPFHNFLRTPRHLRVVLPDTGDLHRRVYDASNAVGRGAWNVIVNHLIQQKLDRRRSQ